MEGNHERHPLLTPSDCTLVVVDEQAGRAFATGSSAVEAARPDSGQAAYASRGVSYG